MKKYNIIYADPPWKYDDKGCRGAVEKQYNTMTVEQLKKWILVLFAQKIPFFLCGRHIQC